ncbi:MAG: hypothetical protein WC769_11475 [Thermodesulfovibrionales bacterium]|jgi:hypothetical protein
MPQRKKVLGNIFLTTAILGMLFLIIEIILQSFGKSTCETQGCKLVGQYTRFDDISIILIGLVTFTALALLSFMSLYRNGTQFEGYINLILVVSLSAEGFFAGYQAFRLHNICAFCLTTFGLFVLLGILRLLYGEKDVIAGFLSFAGVFALFYLILPAGAVVHLPEEKLLLFYGRDCKYCAEVMKEIEENKMKVLALPVGEYSGFLKNMGIEHVPTLYVNRKNQKMFLIGKETIEQYLFCKQKSKLKKETKPKAIMNTKQKPESRTDIGTNESNRLSISNDAPIDLSIQPDDKGICKESEKCK